MRTTTLLLTLSLAACKPADSPPQTEARPPPSPAPAAAPSAAAATSPNTGPGPEIVVAPASSDPVETVVRRELARSEREGRRLMVYVGASWCEPCRRFHDAVEAGQLNDELPGLRFLEFDFDRDEERLKAAGYTAKYIPLFAVPGTDGRSAGRLMAGSVKGDGAVADILPRLKALLGGP